MSKLLELIGKIEDEGLKGELTTELEAYKKDIRGKQQLELEKVKLALETEKKSVENLTKANEDLQKKVDNSAGGEDVDKRIAEMQLKYDALKLEKDESDKLVTSYKEKETISNKEYFAKNTLLKGHKFNLPEKYVIDEIVSNLTEGATKGTYLAVDKLGNQILPETFMENFIEANRQYYVAPGSDTGGSGEGGGGQHNSSGLPKSKEDYLKLSSEKKLELKANNPDHVRKLLTGK